MTAAGKTEAELRDSEISGSCGAKGGHEIRQPSLTNRCMNNPLVIAPKRREQTPWPAKGRGWKDETRTVRP